MSSIILSHNGKHFDTIAIISQEHYRGRVLEAQILVMSFVLQLLNDVLHASVALKKLSLLEFIIVKCFR